MKIITLDDIQDLLSKSKQRGIRFILSKINPNGISRTKSAFNQLEYSNSEWWIIPKVKERWNEMISGESEVNFKQFMMNNHFKDKKKLHLLSIGSGSCNNEIELS